MLRNRRGWGLVPVTAALGAAVLAAISPTAGARPATARAAGASPVHARAAACGGGGGGTSTVSFSSGGNRLVSELNVPVCIAGSLTVSFAGDPAAGCATNGLCEYTGTETFTPGAENVGELNLTTTVRHGHRSTSATMFLGLPSSPATSAVERTVSTGTGTRTTSCSDSAGSALQGGGTFFTLPVSGARVNVDLTHSATPMLGSRCAGPLDVDVASALPSRSVPLRTISHGETTIDLTGGGPFVAHGMSGTVASTLVLRLGRPQRERVTRSPPRGSSRLRTLHTATVRYRVVRLAGSAVATVRSAAAPAACGPFDACGLGGTISVVPGPSVHGSAFFSAQSGSVGMLRAELRGAGRPDARLGGGGSAHVDGTVQARLAQDGGVCSDGVSLRQFILRLSRRGRWITVSLAPSESQAEDPLRTRCPGPDLGEFTGLASARLPATALSRPAFTAVLHGDPFASGPYRVTTASTLAVTLRRGATRLRVIRIPGPVRVPSGDNGGGVTHAG